MTVEPIASALKKAAKMPIEALEGRVLMVGTRRTGTGEHGDWSVQNLKLKDSSGETEIAMWNRDDLSDMKGKAIRLSSFAGDRGIVGLKVKEKDGKKSIEAAKSTDIDILGGSLPEGMKSAHGEHHPESPNVPPPQMRKPLKERLTMYERLYLNSLSAAVTIQKEVERSLGVMISDEQFRTITNQFWQDLKKEGYLEEMSTEPVTPPEEDPDQLP